jgi:hypothetical protein
VPNQAAEWYRVRDGKIAELRPVLDWLVELLDA